MTKVSAAVERSGKHYVPCLTMLRGHSLTCDGIAAPALLRRRGRDGKRLARRDAAIARIAGIALAMAPSLSRTFNAKIFARST